jgi:hypothetical protein
VAQSDWTILSDVLSSSDVDHGVTAGVNKPNGGGINVYGFNSLAVVSGVVAKSVTQVNFAPTAKGGRISAAIKRGVSGGPTGFAPFLFFCLQDTDVAAEGYLLGLSDSEPHHIELRKGALTGGLPDAGVNPTGPQGILLRSTQAFNNDTWHHLRLDVIRQGTDDVLLQCFSNDLGANPVTSPVWTTIAGMEGPQNPTIVGFVDDQLGVNTGSPGFTGGHAGIGFQVSQAARRAFFDHVVVARQL